MQGDSPVVGWVMIAVGAVGGFLPVLTLRNPLARAVCGLIAAITSTVFVSSLVSAAAPGAGLGGLAVGMVAAVIWPVSALLFLIGAWAGGLRLLARCTPSVRVASGLLLAVAAVAVAALFAMPATREGVLEFPGFLLWGVELFVVGLWPAWLPPVLLAVVVFALLTWRRRRDASTAAHPPASPSGVDTCTPDQHDRTGPSDSGAGNNP